MSLIKRMTWAAITMGWMSCGLAVAGEMIDNPQYEHWSQFKPGTYVVTRSKQVAAGQTTETEVKTELKSVSKEKVVLEMTSVTKMQGQEIAMPPQTFEHPAEYEKPESPESEAEAPESVKPKTKEGEEKIEIAGKKMDTKWYEVVSDNDGIKTHSKSWMSDDMPGQVVKSVTKMAGEMPMNVETQVVDFKVIK